jgi:hypothetical protein
VVERISPLGFARVGIMDKRCRVLEPVDVLDDLGGLVPGPPKLVADVMACIEPAMLSRLQKEAMSGGAIANAESYHITFWWVPGVSVSAYLEYDEASYPDETAVTTHHYDVLEVRQVYQDYRLLELLCKERVS